ncbi:MULTISPECIES: Hsp70 family protein [unclassified Micromonospora]|uniref:Hsp70 family protein n=1 Tax=unclassified Micromonospora TaxID=2617518 RepID=UPI0036258044
MPYVLGIDIGNTTTAASVARRWGGDWAQPEALALGAGSATVASALRLSAHGGLTVGGSTGDGGGRTVRGFVRRVGDDVPVVLGGEAYPPQTLTAVLAGWVVEQVRAAEGGPAEAVVVSHPAGWGPHRRELLRRALWEFEVPGVTLLPCPVTVAEGHAAQGFTGDLAAVYALGGDTFEGALVRRNADGTYATLGLPQGLLGCGGAEFVAELTDHVRAVLARELSALDGQQADAAARALPPACERAAHELSVAPQTDVLLDLPTGPARVPVSRAEFEEMIRPAVRATVDLLLRAVHSAGLEPARLDGVLLAGGATRVPLVAELLGAALPGPVAVAPDPQLVAAAGAALAACQVVAPRPRPPAPERGAEPVEAGGVRAAARVSGAAAVPPGPGGGRDGHGDGGLPDVPPPRPPVRIAPLELPRASRLASLRRRGREGSVR